MEETLSRAVSSLCRSSLSVVFCALAFLVNAQNTPVNLVPNWSFTQTNNCPYSQGQISYCENWGSEYGSPDFYHVCGTGDASSPDNVFGSQLSTDNCYVGVASYTNSFSGAQEILTAELLEPLEAAVEYRVRFKVSYADSANFAVCCLGAILSTTPPPQGPYTQNLSSVELILQESEFDTTTWFQYDGIYTAQGGEDNIYLGTFRPESDMNPVLVRPNGSPTYNSANFYVDDVEVYEDDLVSVSENENPSIDVNVYPNPSDGDVTISIIDNAVETDYHLRVMDMMGREVFMEALRTGENQLHLPLSAGTYLYNVSRSDNGEKVEQGSVVIMRRY